MIQLCETCHRRLKLHSNWEERITELLVWKCIQDHDNDVKVENSYIEEKKTIHIENKRCYKCNVIKPITEFRTNRDKAICCVECARKRDNEYNRMMRDNPNPLIWSKRKS